MNNGKQIEKAIILLAGVGLRLRPMTNYIPKCLVRINRKSILINALENLDNNGIKLAVLVVGYKAGHIKKIAGNNYKGMKIIYIKNKIYYRTNNVYSLYLARDYLKDGTVLLEGDVFFEETILRKVLNTDVKKTFWVVDRFTKDNDGCMLTADKRGRIIDIRIVREKLPEYKDNFFKSVGMLKIAPEFGREFMIWLENEVKNGVRDIYYDLVLAKNIQKKPIFICNINKLLWTEIDNMDDLALARKKWRTHIGRNRFLKIKSRLRQFGIGGKKI